MKTLSTAVDLYGCARTSSEGVQMAMENRGPRQANTVMPGFNPSLASSSEMPQLPHDPVKQVLIDYFRCPAGIADFAFQGELRGENGFFRFGSNAICYGKLSSGASQHHATDALRDVFDDVKNGDGTVRLTFSPEEVIKNLRYERYLTQEEKFGSDSWSLKNTIRRTYYFLRPALPVSVRKHLQRHHLKNGPKKAFPKWPVDRTVDDLVGNLLALAMKAQGVKELPFIWFWPDGAKACAIMTHDVETTAGRDFCSKLMDINDSFGIKSAFQIVPESRYEVPPAFVNMIRDRGFEPNVHDLNHDGHLYRSREEFLGRAKRINEYAKKFAADGFRAGVLYRNQEWFDVLDFSYDMSVPNVAHLDPQGGGCCTVMPYFIGGLLELPVTATQDYSLFHILNQYSVDLWKEQIKLILEKNGMASFIVHPDYIIQKQAQDTYKALLGILRQFREERGLWTALPGEVNKWWRARNKMELVEEHGAWRIRGDGSERAQIAYAVLDGNSVSYRVGSKA